MINLSVNKSETVRQQVTGDYLRLCDMLYRSEYDLFERSYASADLTLREQQLLELRQSIDKNPGSRTVYQSIERLGDLSRTSNYLEAERNTLMTKYHFSQMDFQAAAITARKALFEYDASQIRFGIEKGLHNLATIFINLGLAEVAFYQFNSCFDMFKESPQVALTHRGLAICYALLSKGDLAVSHARSALQTCDRLPASVASGLKVDMAELFGQFASYEESFELFSVPSVIMGRRNQARARMGAYLVKRIYEGDYRTDFNLPFSTVEGVPALEAQWKVLNAISQDDIESALFYWAEFTRHSSAYYGPNFKAKKPSIEQTVFFKFMTLFRRERAREDRVVPRFRKGSRVLKLYQLLKNSEEPLRKEDLITAVWDDAYRPEYDARFYKLIQRLKETTGETVAKSNSRYWIEASH